MLKFSQILGCISVFNSVYDHRLCIWPCLNNYWEEHLNIILFQLNQTSEMIQYHFDNPQRTGQVTHYTPYKESLFCLIMCVATANIRVWNSLDERRRIIHERHHRTLTHQRRHRTPRALHPLQRDTRLKQALKEDNPGSAPRGISIWCPKQRGSPSQENMKAERRNKQTSACSEHEKLNWIKYIWSKRSPSNKRISVFHCLLKAVTIDANVQFVCQ